MLERRKFGGLHCPATGVHRGMGITASDRAVRLVLAGGGHAHLAVLEDWMRQPLLGVERWLITPDRYTAYSGMIPGWMSGYYSAADQLIDLVPLAERAGVKLVRDQVCGLDAQRQQIRLASGATWDFDLLSLATGGMINIAPLAGLGKRLLPVRSVDGLVAGWPAVCAAAAQAGQYHLAIIGGGAAGVELALAAATGLRRVCPAARVSIITDHAGLVPGHGARFRGRVERVLRQRGIAVRLGLATGTPTGILLDDGTRIELDCAIAATGSRPPEWLETSGLALDQHGFVAVTADLLSTSHANVFAAGDIAGRIDRAIARSGVHAVKAGPVLAANLRASIQGRALRPYIPRQRTLYLLATGDRRALLSWGALTLAGRVMWCLKDWIDRGFVARYARLGQQVRLDRQAAAIYGKSQ